MSLQPAQAQAGRRCLQALVELLEWVLLVAETLGPLLPWRVVRHVQVAVCTTFESSAIRPNAAGLA